MLSGTGSPAVGFHVSGPRQPYGNRHWVEIRVFSGVTSALLWGKLKSTRPATYKPCLSAGIKQNLAYFHLRLMGFLSDLVAQNDLMCYFFFTFNAGGNVLEEQSVTA